MNYSWHLDVHFTVVFMTVSHSVHVLLKLEMCIPISHVTLETVPTYANIERPTSSQLYASSKLGRLPNRSRGYVNQHFYLQSTGSLTERKGAERILQRDPSETRSFLWPHMHNILSLMNDMSWEVKLCLLTALSWFPNPEYGQRLHKETWVNLAVATFWTVAEFMQG